MISQPSNADNGCASKPASDDRHTVLFGNAAIWAQLIVTSPCRRQNPGRGALAGRWEDVLMSVLAGHSFLCQALTAKYPKVAVGATGSDGVQTKDPVCAAIQQPGSSEMDHGRDGGHIPASSSEPHNAPLETRPWIIVSPKHSLTETLRQKPTGTRGLFRSKPPPLAR